MVDRLIAAITVGALSVASTGGCASPRQQADELPPIRCAVTGGDAGTRTVVVRVDDAPGSVDAGDLRFTVEYRSDAAGRVVETTVEGPSGEVEERVTYVVPGRSALRNQFGADGGAITGVHEVDPGGSGRLSWSCAVARG